LICNETCESREYEIITNTDPKTKEKVVKILLKDKFPPKIRRLASSIAKELRTSLDQAFCEGAVALGRKNAKDIYFPFGKDLKNLKITVAKKFMGVDQELIDFCLSFKPYFGGDSDGILWSMSNMAGSTHQVIVGAGFEGTTSFGEAIIKAVGGPKLIINKWNNLHNEIEVARLGPADELHLRSDFTLRFKIIFSGRAHALSFRPLVPSLNYLLNMVEVIVSGIEAQTARILLERRASAIDAPKRPSRRTRLLFLPKKFWPSQFNWRPRRNCHPSPRKAGAIPRLSASPSFADPSPIFALCLSSSASITRTSWSRAP
jgi:hypothetical protein